MLHSPDMTLTAIHGTLSFSIMLYMILAAGWNLVAAARRQGVSSNTWGILAIAELLVLVQAAIGIVMAVGGADPGRSVHWLYGATSILTLPGYYALSRGRDDRVASLIYAGLCVFLVFIGYRAGLTGV